jgi:hypothetical protein
MVRPGDTYFSPTPKGFQDGYDGFFIIDSNTPLCVYRLTITVLGAGTGKVTSGSGGIDCKSSGVTILLGPFREGCAGDVDRPS